MELGAPFIEHGIFLCMFECILRSYTLIIIIIITNLYNCSYGTRRNIA